MGGIGIVISDGVNDIQYSYGLQVCGASSSDLEWVGKLFGMWCCRNTSCNLILLCDKQGPYRTSHFRTVSPYFCTLLSKVWATKFVRRTTQRHIFLFPVRALDSNSASQLCDCTRWLRVCNWVDRFAKHVLSNIDIGRVEETWMQAQHDSNLSGLAASWQQEADRLAGWALRNPALSPFPLSALVSCLPDPPLVLSFQNHIVFGVFFCC